MNCYLCNSHDIKEREGKVRDNLSLLIHECNQCGLVFLSDFSHINNDFYKESNMSNDKLDTRSYIIEKEVDIDTNRRITFLDKIIRNKDILDFGSGSCDFLFEAKKISKNVTGIELDKRFDSYYSENDIFKFDNIESLPNGKEFDIITAFHVIEHLVNPIDILKQLKSKLSKTGKIIIEVPNANDALLTLYKNKAFSEFTYWSCHLFLYNNHTLELLAKKAGLKLVITKYVQRFPLSNHLYWLSFNKPGGHKEWGNFFDSPSLNESYESQLASTGTTDTLIAIFEKDID